MRWYLRAFVLAGVVPLVLTAAAPLFAGFAGTDLFLPSVGRAGGLAGSFWHTALWIHNPSTSAASVTVQFLPRGSSSPPPGTFATLSIPAGGTWQDMDAIATLFGLTGYAALRITANVEVVASCRMYNQPAGAALKDTTGQDYAAIPASFAIGSGQTTQVLGGFEPGTPDPDFRNGFGYVEVSGNTANVRVTVLGPDGTPLSTWNDPTPVQPFENRYYGAAADFSTKFPGATGTNLRLQFEVTGGAGKIIAVGSLVANGSNDGTTFEMSFADSLLGGGLSAVSHDASLTGDGTTGNPLGIANGGVGNAQLADGSVTDAKVAAGIAYSKLSGAPSSLPPSGPAGGSLSGSYPAPAIANGAVGNAQLAANAVTSDKIVDGAILSADIANGAVTKGKLSAASGSSGQVLGTDGTNLLWQTPPGLTLPYSGSIASGGTAFVLGNSGAGSAMSLTSNTAWALNVSSSAGSAITALAAGTYGLYATANGSGGIGVRGVGPSNGTGVRGDGNPGVAGYGNGGFGIFGQGAPGAAGVYGVSDTNTGVYGRSTSGAGAYGTGVPGVSGSSGSGDGIHGVTSGSNVSGVYGLASQSSSNGVTGANSATSTYGALGTGQYGVYGSSGCFQTELRCLGDFWVGGTKLFLIDHPLDPENKLLAHAAIESSEVLNVYSGNVRTDADGLAVVQLPNWFEALNTDFRYQLTVIGRFAQAIVEEEIKDNRFTIRTNLADVKVSWQVTAKRNDAWMKAHPFAVERQKPEAERGTYLAPLEHGQPEKKGIEWARHPELMQRMEQGQTSRPAPQE